jgi:hypothetical protein
MNMHLIVLVALGLLHAAVAETAQQKQQQQVCYDIVADWWGTRESQKTRADVAASDLACKTWSGQPAYCNSVAARVSLSGYTPAQLTTACTTVGAHDLRCLANPCNSFNAGSCTLQGTAGQCVWFEGAALRDYNAFLVANGEVPLATHGCFRNRCNLPGLGKQKAACPARSVPGVFTCTWCTGSGDAVLDGLGVGCQMTVLRTTAKCAPVNSNGVPKQSVMMNINNNRCQCDVRFPFCKTLVDQERSAWKRRYNII